MKWMHEAPVLDPAAKAGARRCRYALLLNPFYPKDPLNSYGKHVLTPSLALTSIAAVTPANWEVRVWDENLLQGPPPLDPMPVVVGITVHLTFARRAYELAAWYRQRGAVVVLGGLHAMACPDEAAAQADAIALGDGVLTWPAILRDVERGTLQRRYVGSFREPFRAAPAPRRELVSQRDFLTTTSLIATRGCSNRCGFCYLATDGLQMPCQQRDVEQVASEFAAGSQPFGVFLDNNLGANREYLRRLCRALRPLEKIWSAAVTIDVTDDYRLVGEMAGAGCTGVFVGFESLTDRNLAEAGKRTPSAADYARRVRIFHEAGIQVNGSFVLGFDHDGPDCFAELCGWIEANRLECATFHVLTPYPGTPLFRQLETAGRLLHRNWDMYDTGHVVFQPKRMSVEELAARYEWCYERLFSPASIWARRPAVWSAVPGYLAMSVLYKKANAVWPWLIRGRMTGVVWRPLVELSRLRHRVHLRVAEPTGIGDYAGNEVAVVNPGGIRWPRQLRRWAR